MAWSNIPLVQQIDNTVEELGKFLQGKGVEEKDILRTKEVCRDFCNFLGSDIHKAGEKQYTIYQQLHSTTYEDEKEYSVMMGYIKEYFYEEKMSYEAEKTQFAPEIIKPKKGVSLANAELEKMFMNADIDDSPKKKPHQKEEESSEGGGFSAPLLSDSLSKKSEPVDEKTAEENAQLSAENARLSASLAMMFSEAEKQAGPIAGSPKTPLSNDFLFNKRSEKFLLSDSSKKTDSSSKNKKVEDDGVRHEDLSAEYEDELSKLPSTSGDEIYSADVAPNKDENLVRSVDGVAYHFSQKSIRKMRNFEKQKQQNDIRQSGANPIDKSLLAGFQPYLFDANYLIDIPLPEPDQMEPLGHDIVVQYIVSLAPFIVLFMIGILGLLIEVYPLMIALILAGFAFVLVKREILPANQLTPLATILAYLNAKNGRCYGLARTLIAQPKNKQTDDDLSFQQIWAPEPKFIQAMKNRLRDVEAPEIRTVAGSEASNQLLYIHSDGDNYWLLPMVRIKNKWYITDPTMSVHTVSKK